ncbi:hypothetical protein N1031_11500 [Herbiconiux moechotypicola]|uniref:Uncharacterized protein n=1 Tax=Herbiconiux moechotypicola TaxID=637393 RepID=A0ABN3DNV7_9MICO|nr:hypothetical protein [Herbiconiux moechotypicola]MCS5730387.1 hypothetical protein [Herbiconiux moechotypicola]
MRRTTRPGLWHTAVKWAVLAFVAVFAIGVSGWAAHASWTAATVSSGTATANAATASVSATGTAALTTTYQVPVVSPGTSATRIAPISFTNTGTAPLTLTMAIANTNSTLAANITLTLWSQASCGTTIPSSGTVAGTLNAPPSLPSGAASVAVGATATLCVATTLATTTAASQGQTVTATLTLTGRVGTNWVATSTAPTLTQSVYRVADPTPITCVDGTGLNVGTVTLSWPQVTNASQYRVVKPGPPVTIVKAAFTPANPAAPSVTVNGTEAGILSLGTIPVLVQSIDATYGTMSAGTQVNLRAVVVSLLGLRCPL